jgi:DNA mismatch endonuclease (patch repair protein)
MMSGIRSADTKPEMQIRRALHARGYRYRLHDGKVPGRPDLVFRSRRAVILVHGCFWHGHNCDLFRLPGTRTEFWRDKIGRNRKRDADVLGMLIACDWRAFTVWECGLRGRHAPGLEVVVQSIEAWLDSDEMSGEIRGGTDGGNKSSSLDRGIRKAD